MVPRAVPAAADHVIGVFPRNKLSTALASTHRAGFGPQTRVIDGTRADVGQQLARAGLRLLDSAAPAADAVLIVVTAPGRTAIVADLFTGLGAETVLFAARIGGERPIPTRTPTMTPDIRIGNDAGAVPEA
ncbi:MAG: hypothetical protein ACRDJC_24990 [Thermomicrobiales bacterium]